MTTTVTYIQKVVLSQKYCKTDVVTTDH